MTIKDLPKIKDVNISIEKLSGYNFPDYDGEISVDSFVEENVKILTDEFGFIFSPLWPLKQEVFTFNFFRVREVDSFQNISLIREHSYPPIQITSMGRCNFPNYPVFYCSNDPLTALLEVVRDNNITNKKYCISKWEFQPTVDELYFQTFLQTELPSDNFFNELKKQLIKKIDQPFEKSFNKKLDKDRKDGILKYLEFLDSIFIDNKNLSLSASLAHRSLYANHNLRTDILMYPSIQTNKKGVNLAINPNFAENNLKLTRLYEVSLQKYESKTGKIDLSFHRYADVKRDMIVFKHLKKTDIDFKNSVKTDFEIEL